MDKDREQMNPYGGQKDNRHKTGKRDTHTLNMETKDMQLWNVFSLDSLAEETISTEAELLQWFACSCSLCHILYV